MTLIEMSNITKMYNEVPALKGIDLKVDHSEIFALLGPSGCGKTTTLRLIAGFERPNSGQLLLGNDVVAGSHVFLPPEKRKIGMVFQDYALFPHLTVSENIAFGLQEYGNEKDAIVEGMLKLVNLSEYGSRYPYQLSGGQQQRVALARALAPCPIMVVLDEPFSNLDADMRTQMREDMLKILRQSKTTTILVTHDQEEAFSMADKIAVMNNGSIEQIGTPEEIYHHPATIFVAEFVGKADFVEGTINDGKILTEVGIFPGSSRLEDGDQIQLMIRPDDIAITPDRTGTGVIEDKIFKGSEILYTVSLQSGKNIHTSTSSSNIFDIGTRVRVTADPTHIVTFKNGISIV